MQGYRKDLFSCICCGSSKKGLGQVCSKEERRLCGEGMLPERGATIDEKKEEYIRRFAEVYV